MEIIQTSESIESSSSSSGSEEIIWRKAIGAPPSPADDAMPTQESLSIPSLVSGQGDDSSLTSVQDFSAEDIIEMNSTVASGAARVIPQEVIDIEQSLSAMEVQRVRDIGHSEESQESDGGLQASWEGVSFRGQRQWMAMAPVVYTAIVQLVRQEAETQIGERSTHEDDLTP